MVRCAGWVELILLLFGDVVFPELRAAAFDYRCLCLDVTHPLPLSRGEIGVLLFTKRIADYLTSENGKMAGRKRKDDRTTIPFRKIRTGSSFPKRIFTTSLRTQQHCNNIASFRESNPNNTSDNIRTGLRTGKRTVAAVQTLLCTILPFCH